MMTHLVSLGVGTSEPDDHAQTFQAMSELASALATSHDYVNLSSQVVGEDEEEVYDENECAGEHLRHDELTLFKVHEALSSVLVENQEGRSMDDIITDCINAMQNAGILFRERGIDVTEETT